VVRDINRVHATANQTAQPMRAVRDPGIFPKPAVTVVTDTVGPSPPTTSSS